MKESLSITESETTSELGKHVGSRVYLHVSAIDSLSREGLEALAKAQELSGIRPNAYNVVRLGGADSAISFLQYPNFFDNACPTLSESWKVRIHENSVIHRIYEDSLNPPILHRKELLLAPNHVDRSRFEALTVQLEAIGAFQDPVRIGFRLQWERLLSERGFRLVGHDLVPIGNDESEHFEDFFDAETVSPICRHLTALNRQSLSAPIQILNRFGFFDSVPTVFDYGCGRGDDIRGLKQANVTVTGWDPYFASQASIEPADIVNLGFVINVIEDPVERREALLKAYELTRVLLVVSTMVASEQAVTGTPFADGILTKRRTFQKYYTQPELLHYVGQTLEENPIPVAPGICFVFRDKEAEQRFQVGRHRSRLRVHPIRNRLVTPRKPLANEAPGNLEIDFYDRNRELFAGLWQRCLELGRLPESGEIPNLEAIEAAAGSLKKALNYVRRRHDPAEFERAHQQRCDDLLVFFALQLFQRRAPYKELEPRLQRDLRAFFGSYASAQTKAKDLLTKVANSKELEEASVAASERGVGWLRPGKSLEVHSSLVERLPPILRVYVNCAAVLYGDLSQVDVIKIHIDSGKVTLSQYDQFWDSATPKLLQRVKINLRTLGMQIFNYGAEHPSPHLYLKSRFINEECQGFAEQLAFDEQLQSLGLMDLSGFGPDAATLSKVLKQNHWRVAGLRLERLHYFPDLDQMCGRYLTYRQLIECGETQKELSIDNLPQAAETYTALHDLALHIIDPVIEYFGQIELTYGFGSQALSRKIRGRIAPALDQHASHEKQKNDALVCARQGAAVDFLVRDENMRGVAEWIRDNLPFDRLYYYGPSRPVHVSYGPEHSREAIEMIPRKGGGRLPRPFAN